MGLQISKEKLMTIVSRGELSISCFKVHERLRKQLGRYKSEGLVSCHKINKEVLIFTITPDGVEWLLKKKKFLR